MKLIKHFSLSSLIILLLLFCSCTNNGSNIIENLPSPPTNEGNNLTDEAPNAFANGESNMIVEVSPSDKSLTDLATQTYDERQLTELAQFGGAINELNEKYPIECMRKGNDTYRVSYLGDGSIAVLVFDNSGNKLLGNTYSVQLSKSDFDGLENGQLLEEVQALDPNGEYLFLYTGRNDIPRESSHYTIDGYLITIEYDDSNAIIGIIEELM